MGRRARVALAVGTMGATTLLGACGDDLFEGAASLPPILRTTTSTTKFVAPTTIPTRYRVRRGEILVKIAARFGYTQEELMAANNLKNPDYIWVGQMLKLPPKASTTTTTTTTTTLPDF